MVREALSLDDHSCQEQSGKAAGLEKATCPFTLRETPVAMKRAMDKNQTAQLLVSAVENTAGRVLILDSRGIIRYMNPAAAASIGMSLHGLRGKPYAWETPQFEELSSLFSCRGTLDRPWKGRITRPVTGGADQDAEVIISPVTDAAGKTTGYTVVELDVTEEVKRQKDLEHERRIEVLGVLAGGIAHDFNNVLQTILINTELVSDLAPCGTQEREYLDQMIEAAQRGRTLVNRIKMFGFRRKRPSDPIALSPVVRNALDSFTRWIPSNITFRQWIAAEESLVRADPAQICQLIIDLCMNAVQAMKPHRGFLGVSLKEIDLSAAVPAMVTDLKPGSYAKLTVRDTGTGIKPELRERIFDPFFTTGKTGRGTGLGLAAVFEAVRNAGGSILLHSKAGKGTRFEVCLPLYRDAPDQPRASGPQATGHDGKHILLVDDNTVDLCSVKGLLVHLGYRVTALSDPGDALCLFRETPGKFALLITDQVMPRMRGHELITRVHGIRKDLPVILCSGSEETLHELQEHRRDIHAFILKPFPGSLLADVVRRALI